MEHTVKAFEEDITRLRGLVAEMGGLAELSVQESLDAIVNGDEDLGNRVIARDKEIDALEMEIDRLAVRTIALRAPMADDLREVIAALKIAGVVERIGDYSKNIAKASKQIQEATWCLAPGRRPSGAGHAAARRGSGARARRSVWR